MATLTELYGNKASGASVKTSKKPTLTDLYSGLTVSKQNTALQTNKDKNKGGLLGGVGYTAAKLGTGAFSILEGIWDYTAGGIADLFGADEWAEQQFANNITAGWNQDLDEWYNPGKGMQIVGDVSSGVGNTLAGLGVAAAATFFSGGALAPVAGSIAAGTMGLGAAGGATSEAYAKTGNLGFKEYAYGALSGGTEAALEKFTGVTGKYATRLFGKETAKTIAKKTILSNMASDFAGEFIEEAISEMVTPYYQRWTKVDPNAENATIQQIGYAGLVGGLSGALMGGIGTGISTVQAMNRGNEISKNKEYTQSVLSTAEKFAEHAQTDQADNEGYQYISKLVAEYKARDNGTGEVTLQQKKLLGQMERAGVALIYQPTVQKSKEKIIADADNFAQYINARNIIDGSTGKPFHFANGAELLANDNLVTQFAVADALGELMLTPDSVYSLVTSKIDNGIMQSDFRNFQKNATAEQKNAINELFGIDVDGVSYDDFINSIKQADRAKLDTAMGGMSARASAKKAIDKAISAKEKVNSFDEGANIVDGTTVYKTKNGNMIAVVKQGNAYYLSDGKAISKKLTLEELKRAVREINGVQTTTQKTAQKTTEEANTEIPSTETKTAQESETTASQEKTEAEKKAEEEAKRKAEEEKKAKAKAHREANAKKKAEQERREKQKALAKEFVTHMRKTSKERGWTSNDVFKFIKDHPELDFIDRMYAKDETAKKDLVDFLKSIDDIEVLDGFKLYMGGAYTGYLYKHYRGTVQTFQNAVKKRMQEVGGGTNLGIQNHEATLAEVEDLFYKLNKNPEVEALAKRVFFTAKRLGVNIRFINATFAKDQVAGDNVGDMIEYKTSYFNDTTRSDQQKASTIVHELIHACTMYAMIDSSPIKSGNIANAAAKLKDIYEQIKNDEDIKREYGGTNADEMVAELSNEKFAAMLKKKNLWQRILDAICELFGFNRGTTAYDSAMQCLDYMLDNPDVNAYRQYAERQRRLLSYTQMPFGQLKGVETQSKRIEGKAEIRNQTLDSDGNKLSKAQQEFFKDSKVRYDDGSLIVVYHGSPNVFTEFSHRFMNTNGNAHGRGFYFTDDAEYAKGYKKEGGQLLKGYLNIKKPASETEITIRKNELVKLIKATCEAQAQEFMDEESYDNIDDALLDTWVSNYVDTYSAYSMDSVYRQVAESVFNSCDNDVDMLAELTNGGAGTERVLSLARKTIGYDGIIFDNGNGTYQFIAFESNQFKNADNANPTESADIRRQKSQSKDQKRTLDDAYFEKLIDELGWEDILAEGDLELYGDKSMSVEEMSEELKANPKKADIYIRRTGLGKTHTADGKTAVMKQSRIDDAIDDSGAQFHKTYARSYITRISPKDFIDLTVMQNHVDRTAFDTGVIGDHGGLQAEYNYDQALKDSRQSPYLHIDKATGKIIGHNGRHRMRALEKAGIKSVEIEVQFYDEDGRLIKYDAETIPDVAISSQFDTGIETHLYDVMPLNETHRAEIESTYGEKANPKAEISYKAIDKKRGNSYTKKTKYINNQLSTPTLSYIRNELNKIYSGVEGGIADGIAIAKDNTIYIIDSGKDNGNIDFGVRKKITVSDESKRKVYLQKINEKAAENGFIDRKLFGKLGVTVGNNSRSNVGRKQEKNTARYKRESQNNQSGISQSNGARRIQVLKTANDIEKPDIRDQSLNPIKGSDKVMTELPDDRVSIKDFVQGKTTKEQLVSQAKGSFTELTEGAKVYLTNAQAGLERVMKEMGIKDADARTNYVRAGRNAGQNAIDIDGAQFSLDGEVRVGDSLGKIWNPIYKANEKDGNTYADFELYLLHQHNVDRMAVDKPVFGEDVTAEDSKAAIAELEKEYPQFKEMAYKVWKFSDNLVDVAIDSGMWSQEYADTLREMYSHYVPTFREKHMVKMGAILGKNNLRVNNAMRKATGSSERILPIDDMLAAQAIQRYKAARINKLLVDMMESGEHAEFKVIATEDADMLAAMESLEDLVTFYSDKKKNTHQVTFYNKGKKVTAEVSNLVYKGLEAFQGSSAISDNVVLSGIAKVNSTFKKLVTSWNPFFSFFKNPIRDMQEALLYTKYPHREFLKNYNRARQEIKHNGKYWQEAKAAGITTASVYDYQKGIAYKQKGANSKFMKGLNWLQARQEYASNAFEMAPRMAEYISAREAGLSVQEALLQAQDVTTNFGRGGTFAKLLNSTVMPFLNPSIQGFSKMWRSYTGIKENKKAWVNLIIRSLILGIGVTALNDLLNGDDEEYENLSDYVKEQNYVLALGNGDFLKIPKGRVLGVFGSVFLRGKRYSQGDTEAWKGFIDSVKSSVTPVDNFTRHIFSPFQDVKTNTAWHGGTIEGQRWSNTEPKNRYDESTSSIAIWLGQVFNYSPIKIDYLFEQYGGIVADLVLPATSTQAESGIFTQNMLVNSTTNSKWSNKFYSTLESYNYKKSAGDLQAKGVVRYLTNINSTISDMYDQKRAIQADKTLSNEEKLKQTKIIQAGINILMQEAVGNAEYVYGEMGKYNLTGFADEKEAEEAFDRAYIDSMSLVMGEEYALKAYNKSVYEKATKLNTLGINYASYYDLYFDLKEITSDKNKDGTTVAGSKKKKVIKYVMSQNLSTVQKLMLIMSQGYSIADGDIRGVSARTAKQTVAKYITKLDLTREEKTELAKMLGFTVKNGKILIS